MYLFYRGICSRLGTVMLTAQWVPTSVSGLEGNFWGEYKHDAVLLEGERGRGNRWKQRQVCVQSSTAAYVGLLRHHQVGAGNERKGLPKTLQWSREGFQALVESVQERRAEELLWCPDRKDRFLQWTGVLKVGYIKYRNLCFKIKRIFFHHTVIGCSAKIPECRNLIKLSRLIKHGSQFHFTCTSD